MAEISKIFEFAAEIGKSCPLVFERNDIFRAEHVDVAMTINKKLCEPLTIVRARRLHPIKARGG